MAETVRYIESTFSNVKSFKAQLVFYEDKIQRGAELLPQLERQIKNIKEGTPLWLEEVRKYKLSLGTHCKRLTKQLQHFELLEEKDKILEGLKKLERQ